MSTNPTVSSDNTKSSVGAASTAQQQMAVHDSTGLDLRVSLTLRNDKSSPPVCESTNEKQNYREVGATNYLDYIGRLKNVWGDLPDVDIVLRDFSYVIPLPKDHTTIPNLWRSVISPILPLFHRIKQQKQLYYSVPALDRVTTNIKAGHGKSAFLRAVSGQLALHKQHSKLTSGDIRWNGLSFEEARSKDVGLRVEKLTAYATQQDHHLSTLTVRETIQFAIDNAVVAPLESNLPRVSRPQTPGDNHQQFLELHADKANMIIEMLGLQECADTIIGNDLLRGISGGQRKRVTVAEMMATNARLLALDEVTNGLDAAVATQLTRSLRAWTRLSNGSVICALQQPTPEMVDMFDDIILLSNGRLVYHGPRQQVIPYVAWLGASKTEGFDDADFLVAYLSDPQRYSHKLLPPQSRPSNNDQEKSSQTQTNGNTQLSADSARHSNGVLDFSALRSIPTERLSTINSYSQEGLIAGWESTNICQNTSSTVQHCDKQAATRQTVSKYTRMHYYQKSSHAVLYHMTSILRRQLRLTFRDPSMIGPRLGQAVFLGFLIGGLFYGLSTDPGSNVARMGLILSALAISPWANLNELPSNDEAKPVLWKQIDSGFYPSLSLILSQTLFSLPLLALETLVMSSIIYFLAAFDMDAGRYLFFWFCLFLNDLVFSIVFRIVSFISRNQFIAQQAGGPAVLMALGFAGFLITYNNIPKWLWEFYWISPFTWISRSMAINEFNAPRYDVYGVGANGKYGRQGDLAMDYWYMPHEFVYKWTTVPVMFVYWMIGSAIMLWAVSDVRIETSFGTRRSRPTESEQPTHYQQGSVQVDLNGVKRQQSDGASSVLPFNPVGLVWKNIFYDVKLKDGSDRRLLTDVSAYCEPGECTALMGSSGAGKTTLMDVIAGRKTSGKIQGQVLCNGRTVSQQVFQKMIGYVEQTDNHMPFSTVKEALTFSAALRLPANVTADQRASFVNEILEILELTSLANLIVGDASINGLSPAQTKLVTIGVELAANPSIICLDEPTSGIDSRAALVVMRAVRRIAATGRTVLCTIHQPSFELFNMFDRLILLKTGGTLVYNYTVGDNGHTVIQYFETSHHQYAKQHSDKKETKDAYSGFSPKHNGTINPASWMLDVLGEARERNLDYTKVWASHPWSREAYEKIEQLSQRSGSEPRCCTATENERSTVVEPADTNSRANFITQTHWVIRREFCSYWRNSSYNLVRALVQLTLGIMFGLLYLNIFSDARNGGLSQPAAKMNSVEGGILMSAGIIAVLNCATALPVIASERAVFYREQASKVYSPYAYAVSLMLVEIPFTALAVISYTVPWYYLTASLPSSLEFWKVFLLFYMGALIMNSMAHWLSSALPNLVVSTQVLGVLYIFMYTFGGVFIRSTGPGAIEPGWMWIYHMNFLPKAVNAISMAQYECSGPQCPTVVVGPQATHGTGGVETISDYLAYDFLGARTGSGYYSAQIGWLFLTYAIIRCFSFLSLRFISYLKR